jgi:hypothetical protein
MVNLSPAGDVTITAGYGAYVPCTYTIADGHFLEIADAAIMEIG